MTRQVSYNAYRVRDLGRNVTALWDDLGCHRSVDRALEACEEHASRGGQPIRPWYPNHTGRDFLRTPEVQGFWYAVVRR